MEEAELSYQYIPVKIGQNVHDGTQSLQYKLLNSQGKAPTLIEGDVIITESAEIVNYIATTTENKNLIPKDNPTLRAQYDQLCFFVLSDLEQPLWTKGKHSFVLPAELRVEEIKKTTEYEFAKSLKALETQLQDKEFAIDNHFTMADILVAHTLHWADKANFSVPDKLMNYCNQMYQRPACQRALIKAN